MSETSTNPTILGSVREENGAGTAHVEDVYPTDIHDLWAAICRSLCIPLTVQAGKHTSRI